MSRFKMCSKLWANMRPGKMTNAELKDLEDHACPGPGACGGQFTANTMAIAFEFLGISADGPERRSGHGHARMMSPFECGQMVMDLLKQDLRPRQIITRKSLENAIAAVATTGGSTNAVLHLWPLPAKPACGSDDRRLRQDQPQGAPAGRSETGRAIHGRRPLCGRRDDAGRETAAGRGHAPSAIRPPSPAARSAKKLQRRRKRRGNRYCGRCPIPSNPRAASSF